MASGSLATAVAEDHVVESGDFSLKISADWQVRGDDKTIMTIVAPSESAEDTFRENIRIVRYPTEEKMELQVVLRKKRIFPGRFKVVDEGEVKASKIPMV